VEIALLETAATEILLLEGRACCRRGLLAPDVLVAAGSVGAGVAARHRKPRMCNWVDRGEVEVVARRHRPVVSLAEAVEDIFCPIAG